MTFYLLDTNHVSAMLMKNPRVLQEIHSKSASSSLGISMPSIAELWFMVFNSNRIQSNTDDLNLVLNGLTRWDFTENAATEFGQVKAGLRRMGRTIPDADSQIAAMARTNDLTVLTDDAHFTNISNLKTENRLR
jgi:tRNA(fMet)-specific endonuclease VapC